ncbi:MAG: EAL domain-containing protein [Ahniella sp.]|nr:EAL domain-containing protein [Ahniella sp.]
MTRLPNRLAFEHGLRARLRGPEGRAVLLYVDLDQFKVINDSLSHAAGDAFVLGAAGVLQSRLKPGQFLARIGGDEFALIVEDDGHVPAFAEGLVEAVAALRLPWQDQVMTTTASIGAAPFEADGSDFGEVLARGDAACQSAKDQGGNRLHWSEATDEGVIEKRNAMRWAVRLASAIDEDRFQLHCQSIVPLRADHGLRRFEVLLRMREEGASGLLMPGQFVPAAERFNLGPRLDRYVLDRTLRWFEASPSVLAEVQHVSVNLSAATLTDEGFPDFVRRRLADSVLKAECLCFEITETSAVRDLAKAARMIDRVRELGARFALDDFGTGFCSFAYLASLRVDYFKIDGSFVRDLGHSPLALSIVRSIVDIGKVTNTLTVAECVETTALRAKLGALGVDFAQGYAIDRPREISEYFSAPPPDSVALVG